jgi:hypothetical protein
VSVVVAERDFQAAVVELARLSGWRCYHTYDSRRSAHGFPDLVLVRDGRLLFAELKSERGRVTADQRAWLSLLEGCPGVEVYVWRPLASSWPEIERVLSRRKHD